MDRRPSSDPDLAPRRRPAATWVLLTAAALGAVLLLLIRTASTPVPGGAGDGPAGLGTGGAPQHAPGSNLEVTLVSCGESGDSIRAGGYVRNQGGVVVRYVEVEVTWLDAGGEPVDTRVTYAIGGEVFTPGDSISFETATGELAAVDCDASLRNYEPL